MDPGTKQMGTAVTGIFVLIIICACCVYCAMQVAQNMNTTPAPGPGPAPAPAPGSGPLCANVPLAVFPSPSPAPSLTITAPTGTKISSIDYASLGNPTGVCGSYTDGPCMLYPDSTVKNLVSTACIGENTCSVKIDPSTFGALTQPDDTKCLKNSVLQVQYTTTVASPAPAPSPGH